MAGIKSFKGKSVLLTGAAGGIGSVLAKLLFEEGASLFLVDKDSVKLKELKKKWQSWSYKECIVTDTKEENWVGRPTSVGPSLRVWPILWCYVKVFKPPCQKPKK